MTDNDEAQVEIEVEMETEAEEAVETDYEVVEAEAEPDVVESAAKEQVKAELAELVERKVSLDADLRKLVLAEAQPTASTNQIRLQAVVMSQYIRLLEERLESWVDDTPEAG